MAASRTNTVVSIRNGNWAQRGDINCSRSCNVEGNMLGFKSQSVGLQIPFGPATLRT